MAKVSDKQRSTDAAEELKNLLNPGDTLYVIERKRTSRYKTVDVFTFHNDEPVNISRPVAVLVHERWTPGGFRIQTGGADIAALIGTTVSFWVFGNMDRLKSRWL